MNEQPHLTENPDVEAQQLDRVWGLGMVGAIPLELAVAESERLARAAVVRSGQERDFLRLCGVLAWRAGIAHGEEDSDTASRYSAEALSILDDLANAGSETATIQLLRLADGLAATGMGFAPFQIATGFHAWRQDN